MFEWMRFVFPCLAAVALACVAAVSPVMPELFGEGVISTPDYELNAAFLPDGKTLYFTKSTPNMGFWTIVSTRLLNGTWTPPEVAPFSGQYSDADLAVAPGGPCPAPRGGRCRTSGTWTARRAAGRNRAMPPG